MEAGWRGERLFVALRLREETYFLGNETRQQRISDRTIEMTTRATKPSRFDSPQQEAYLNLWRTYDRLRMLEDELFARHDLTAQQYNVLRLLRARHPEPVPTLALARRLVSRAPDITRMLDKLEQHGWIRRERPVENRRQVLVRISPAGIELLDRLEGPVRECHRRQLGHMSGAELKKLILLLRSAREPHEEPEGPWRG